MVFNRAQNQKAIYLNLFPKSSELNFWKNIYGEISLLTRRFHGSIYAGYLDKVEAGDTAELTHSEQGE